MNLTARAWPTCGNGIICRSMTTGRLPNAPVSAPRALPAPDFWNARNTLTQRSIGPESIPTAELDAGGLEIGDVAGLALLNYPYAWIGVRRDTNGIELVQFDQATGTSVSIPIEGSRVWLRAHCDFLAEKATFSYGTDGLTFHPWARYIPWCFSSEPSKGSGIPCSTLPASKLPAAMPILLVSP